MLLKNQTLNEVMQYPLVTIPPDSLVMDAMVVARERAVHHLPVVAKGELLGLLCTCDMQEAKPAVAVETVMKAPVLTLGASETAHRAAQLMHKKCCGSVVVMSQDGPVGIVTRGDLLERYADADEVLDGSECECCGLTQHVSTNRFGQHLCVFCRERAQADAWFDLGGPG